ncbi:MAG: HypC/HybG/HupF family hydrogenase formation chaperone [Desulfatiglandales bacterium]
MCLAIPSKILKIEGHDAVVDVEGIQRKASVLLLENVQIGDYVIVHAGFAIHRIDEDEAVASLELLKEAAAVEENEE